jgi:hypothetical protein
MANTLANSLTGIQPVPPLVARGGALRTFGGLAFLLAVILSVLGVYLIEDQFTNPLASQPLGLFAAAFLLATAMALVYELVQLPTSIWWTGNETSLVPRTSTRPVRVPGQRPPGATKNAHPASPIPPSPVSIPNHHASNLAKVPAPTVRPSSTLPAPVADPRPPSLAKPPAATPTPAPLVRVTDQLPLSLAKLLTPAAPPTPIPPVRVAHQPRPDTAKIPIVPATPSPRPPPLVRVATLFPFAKKVSVPVAAPPNPAAPARTPGLRSPAAPKKPPKTAPRADQRRDLPYQHCYVDRVRVRA